jgi:multiple sugar transport system ATP-binding protein
MRTELKELLQTLKTTAIYVTHDQVEAMTMADRVVVMRDGIIEQVGFPLDLYDKPTNTFVAKFIGSPSMNLLPAVLDSDTGTVQLDDNTRLNIPKAMRVPSGSVVLGFRPEHVTITESDSGIPVRTAVIEPMGGQTQVLFKFGARDVTATFSDRVNIRVGDKVWLQPKIAHSHLFTSTDGNRIE